MSAALQVPPAAATPRRQLVAIDEMEVGGSQRQIVHLLGALDRSQWTPELVYFRSESFLVGELRRQGVAVHRLSKRGAVDVRFLRDYRELLQRGRYDLVHAFSFTAELWTLLALRSFAGAPPLVSSLRNLSLDAPGWQWRLKRLVLAGSAATIANSQAAARAAAQLARWPQERIAVIGNGIPEPAPLDAAGRARLRRELGVPAHRPFGLFVGRLAAVKNLPSLLAAMQRIPSPARPWLALAGDGPEAATLAALRTQLGLEGDVHLLGERADATRLMQAADFLVLCSRQEGLSNALIEAMLAGCAVVATAVGGNVELIDQGRTGLLVLPDDPDALAGAIRRLCEDPPLRAALARDAREAARARFSTQALARATGEVYMRVLQERGRGRSPLSTARAQP